MLSEEEIQHIDRRTIARSGERRLMSMVDEPAWLTYWDHLAFPFYQDFGDAGKGLTTDPLLDRGRWSDRDTRTNSQMGHVLS